MCLPPLLPELSLLAGLRLTVTERKSLSNKFMLELDVGNKGVCIFVPLEEVSEQSGQMQGSTRALLRSPRALGSPLTSASTLTRQRSRAASPGRGSRAGLSKTEEYSCHESTRLCNSSWQRRAVETKLLLFSLPRTLSAKRPLRETQKGPDDISAEVPPQRETSVHPDGPRIQRGTCSRNMNSHGQRSSGVWLPLVDVHGSLIIFPRGGRSIVTKYVPVNRRPITSVGPFTHSLGG